MKRIYDLIRRNYYVFLCLLCALALVSNWRVLHFTFWIDDWVYLWRSLYDPRELLTNWLHFGTSLEFFVFGKILGAYPLYWQLFGILLRVVLACVTARFMYVLSSSKTAGMYAGFFTAASSIGDQSVGWASAHIVLIEAIVLTLGFTSFLLYLKDHNRVGLIISLEYILLGVLLDFIRAVPIFFVLGYVVVVMDRKHHTQQFKRFIPFMVLSIAILGALFITLLLPALFASPMTQGMLRVMHAPKLLLKLFVYIGNFIGTIWNLIIGWIHPVLIDSGTGLIHILSIVSLASFLCVVYAVRKNIRTYLIPQDAKVLRICMVWILAFLCIHFIFEPRYSYDPFHRYMLISAIGSTGILAYLLSRLGKNIGIPLVIFFTVIFVYGANTELSQEFEFRDSKKVDSVWAYIHANTPTDEHPKIFYYFGVDPAKKYILDLSGSIPFELIRKTKHASDWVYTINSIEAIVPVVCGNDKNHKQVALSDVYGWFIYNSGTIIPITGEIQQSVANIIQQRGCSK